MAPVSDLASRLDEVSLRLARVDLVVQVLPAVLIVSHRYAKLASDVRFRALLAALYRPIPNSPVTERRPVCSLKWIGGPVTAHSPIDHVAEGADPALTTGQVTPETRSEVMTARRTQRGPSDWILLPLVLIGSCLIIFLRSPPTVLHPELWAEDGKVWFQDAYNQGWLTPLFHPQVGYLQTLPAPDRRHRAAAPLELGTGSVRGSGGCGAGAPRLPRRQSSVCRSRP